MDQTEKEEQANNGHQAEYLTSISVMIEIKWLQGQEETEILTKIDWSRKLSGPSQSVGGIMLIRNTLLQTCLFFGTTLAWAPPGKVTQSF